jgi:hypothetical protein
MVPGLRRIALAMMLLVAGVHHEAGNKSCQEQRFEVVLRLLTFMLRRYAGKTGLFRVCRIVQRWICAACRYVAQLNTRLLDNCASTGSIEPKRITHANRKAISSRCSNSSKTARYITSFKMATIHQAKTTSNPPQSNHCQHPPRPATFLFPFLHLFRPYRHQFWQHRIPLARSPRTYSMY